MKLLIRFSLLFVGFSVCEFARAADLPKFFIQLTRDVCYGFCPSYVLSVDESGKVSYEGREFVCQKGPASRTVSPEQARRLAVELDKIEFLEIPRTAERDCPKGEATDNPTATIKYRSSEKENTIHDYHGCIGNSYLEKMRPLEKLIDETLLETEWIGNCTER